MRPQENSMSRERTGFSDDVESRATEPSENIDSIRRRWGLMGGRVVSVYRVRRRGRAWARQDVLWVDNILRGRYVSKLCEYVAQLEREMV